MAVLLSVVIFATVLLAAGGSLYDPHVFPDTGPYFEGWYVRVSDLGSEDSVGLLFGTSLPKTGPSSADPVAVVSVLWRKCDTTSTCKLVSTNAKIFNRQNVNITKSGSCVIKQPDVTSPPDFRWAVQDLNSTTFGFFQQTGDNTSFNFTIGDLQISGEARDARWWNKEQTGPEGWLHSLPLPLHWFVYSVGSNLTYLYIWDRASGEKREIRNGLVHMEKNWGGTFPKKWIWSQGCDKNNPRVSFALSGGLVDLYVTSVDAYLIGYRNPDKGLALDFRPDNSVVKSYIRGCSGTVALSVHSLRYKLAIHLTASSETFSDCLLGPKADGFSRACVESYDGGANVTVWKLGLTGYSLIDQVAIDHVAFEFGGEHVCGNKCRKTRNETISGQNDDD